MRKNLYYIKRGKDLIFLESASADTLFSKVITGCHLSTLVFSFCKKKKYSYSL